MNFALVGIGPLTLPFVQAISSNPDYQLSFLITSKPVDASILQDAPALQVSPDWESLLQGTYDLVIVTGSAEEDLQAARSLYAQRQPLAICPQYCMQAEFIYELSLIQDDNRVLLIPVLPDLGQRQVLTLMNQFQQHVAANLNWERTLPENWLKDHTATEQQNIINEWLLNDLMLLRKLGGPYNQVTAMRTLNSATYSDQKTDSEATQKISHLSVTLAGTDLPPVCWTLKQGNKLHAELHYRIGDQLHHVAFSEPQSKSASTLPIPDATVEPSVVSEILNRLVDSVINNSADPDLRELTRGFETVDAVQRSIKRRRSVDLYFETTSERSQFKSQMTAIGCGVLLLTPMLLVVRLMLGVMMPEQQLLLQITGGLVFTPLFLFLLFQLLIFFAQPAANQQ